MPSVSEMKKKFEPMKNKNSEGNFSSRVQMPEGSEKNFKKIKQDIEDWLSGNKPAASQDASDPKLSRLQKEYQDLINKVYYGNITKLYNIDNAAGNSYAAKLDEMVNGQNGYNVEDENEMKKAKQALKELDKEVEKALKEKTAEVKQANKRATVSRKSVSAPANAAAAAEDEQPNKRATVSRKSVSAPANAPAAAEDKQANKRASVSRRSFSSLFAAGNKKPTKRSTISYGSVNAPADADDKQSKRRATVSYGRDKSLVDEEDTVLDVRDIVKSGAKVKSYLRKNFGTFDNLNAFIGRMATNYKLPEEQMPIKDLKKIYGTKGGLMMIYRLENEDGKNKKSFSTYGKYCRTILKDYRDLKVEAAVLALSKKPDDIKEAFKKVNKNDIKKFKNLAGQMVKLKKEGKLKSSSQGTDECSLEDLKVALVCLGAIMGMTVAIPGLGLVPGVYTAYKISEKHEMKGIMNKLKSGLKNIRDDDTKKVVNNILRLAENTTKNADKNDSSKEENGPKDKFQEYYEKRYNSFVNNSGKLASKYLLSEGIKKIDRLKMAKDKQYVKGKDVVIDAYKIIFMCLVAACSKNEKHSDYGTDFFSRYQNILKEFVK